MRITPAGSMRCGIIGLVLIFASPALSERIAMVGDGLPGQDPAITATLKRAAGGEVTSIDPGRLQQIGSLAAGDMLILPSARSIPLEAIPAIRDLLNRQGKVVACGLPLGGLHVFNAGGRWITRDQYDAE